MSAAEQIIADELWQKVDALGYPGRADDLAAHVVAALTNAGKAIVDPNALDSAIWLYLGDECDNANEPNYEENNYDAGFIAGLAHAQETIRAQLPGFLAAARVAEGGERGE
ncbi:hypothetical protein GS913_18575 [Rhodococcus hoagii]|nr:hypothetical protein [Prescottella equi]NKT51065.1 hypothetical protein [Prescottella equi]NKU46706.1 hypothetical protein [Prescottella equi]NKV21537.1 hypothetical protein [Prescottella equi]